MYNNIEFVTNSIRVLAQSNNIDDINVDEIAKRAVLGSTDNMTEYDFYTILVNICDDLSSLDYIYSKFAAQIEYKKLMTNVPQLDFSEKMKWISNNLPGYLNNHLVDNLNGVVIEKINELVKSVNPMPEYLDLFGYRTLAGSYLIQVNKQVIETPVDLFMRVAFSIHFENTYIDKSLDRVEKTFLAMYNGLYTHATPTLYNAGTSRQQMSSCFLLGTEDSLDSIFKTFADCGAISKWSGGIGLHISNIRANKSKIAGTNGESEGIIPMIRILNNIACYVNQGGRGKKRPGAIAVYLEPWHADVIEFLELKLNTGDEKLRARDLFYALWIPDLFMKQLEIDGEWFLMCPHECPGLPDVYGEEFEKLYWSYVNQGKYRKIIRAKELMVKLTIALAEGGVPYGLFKDSFNGRSNQKNIGVIKSSNLCCEIAEVSNSTSYAVCNLASIAVNRFLKSDGIYDYANLERVAYDLTINLNRIIDLNYYPVNEAQVSNFDARPIAIGIQGMGDLLLRLRLEYESQESIDIESRVMETIYWGSLNASCDLAKEFGPYKYFEGSPFSQGILQFDMGYEIKRDLVYPWDDLKERIKKYGTRNSLVTSLMPTASTSQILGNMECFEPLTSNLVSRKTSVGTFKIVNKYLIDDLKKLNLWNESMKNRIILEKGSIQLIEEIPTEIKRLYKTVWEIKQRAILDHALARQPFVDQSQSMNIYFEKIEYSKVMNTLFYGWRKGLKTGYYYMKSEASNMAMSVVQTTDNTTKKSETEPCEMCSA